MTDGKKLKLQKTGSKHPDENPKHQDPSTKGAPNSKFQYGGIETPLGVWSLGFLWSLVFGIWCFAHSSIVNPKMNDLRYAIRQSLKHKGSSLLAMLILALGIGGTTAVFSVADKVLLNPIPGRNSDRLVTLREVDIMHDSHWQVSPPLIEELATHSNLIESLTYCFQGPEEKKFRVGEKEVTLRGVAVARNFFELLELRPLAGRAFLPGEGNKEAEKTIVISY